MRSRQHISRDEVLAPNGVVAARRSAEAEAGLAMLQAGGNAIDAAVAVGFLATVVEPMMVGLAGCGFLLYHEAASGKNWCVDFAPRAPAAARPDMFEVLDVPAGPRSLAPAEVKDGANASGHRSAGVPGLVAGLCEAHRRWGWLPLPQVLEPAIHYAEQGWVCDWYTGYMIAADLKWFRRYPDAAKIFAPGGYVPDPYTNAKITNRDLGAVFRRIARDGPRAFYEGEVAHAIAEDMRANGGILTAKDLAAYEAEVYEPLSVVYRGHEVHFPRSSSGSWTIAQALNILERFDLGAMGHNSSDHLHTLVEAARQAFADRYYHLGDPAFVPVPLDGLLSHEYAASLAAEIAPARTVFEDTGEEPWQAFAYRALHDPWRFDSGRRAQPWRRAASEAASTSTTHTSIVDRERNLVSLTETAAELWGAKFVTPGTGIVHADAMVWFNPLPGAANSIAPGKRPLCNMGPLLVTRGGKPFLALGSPGGRKIMNCNLQVLSNVVDFGMSIQPAVSAPRIDASGRVTLYDDRIEEATAARLAAKGHRLRAVEEANIGFGGEFAKPVAVVVGDDGLLRGGVEAFRMAEACGY
jgi:gamma-glutamyltranspeptidase/glutathione hydrolase